MLLNVLAILVIGIGWTVAQTLRATSVGNALSFTILQVSDMHYTGDAAYGCSPSPCSEANTTQFLSSLISAATPDLVVFSGDLVENHLLHHNMEEAKQAIDASLSQVIAHRVPWAFIFGNHDEGV
uniref:Secreted protein n=1 Tax=Achlya hypogyna TaxID=1202772 RepID=A0A0A7CP62_ACHHY|nr:secreted protein [Achlya hypogyna]